MMRAALLLLIIILNHTHWSMPWSIYILAAANISILRYLITSVCMLCTSFLPRCRPSCCCLPFIVAGLAIGMHTGMVLVLCIWTAIHRTVDAHLVATTKDRGATLPSTGRRPVRCTLHVLCGEVGLVVEHNESLLLVVLAMSNGRFNIGLVGVLLWDKLWTPKSEYPNNPYLCSTIFQKSHYVLYLPLHFLRHPSWQEPASF